MFELGKIVMTSGVSHWINGDFDKHESLIKCINRHQNQDWGDVDEEDWQTNNFSLNNNMRILSSYHIFDRKIWIITEADRSVTTALFPNEY